VPQPKIKDEAKETVKKERDRSSSSSSRRSDSSRNRDPRSRPGDRDKENGKRSKSPERRHPRFDPPRRSPPRRPPPPRRNSPHRRNFNNTKPGQPGRSSFFEEMVTQFPELVNQNQNQNPMQYNAYGQPVPQMNFMPQQRFMPPQMVANPFAPQFQQMGNMNMHPMMPTPTPVPAPLAPPGVNLPPTQPEVSQIPQQPKKPINLQQVKLKVRSVNFSGVFMNLTHLPSLKAFKKGEIGLTDFLRQVSNQKSKTASIVDINAKKAKGLKRFFSCAGS
jgi:hypothetical protein